MKSKLIVIALGGILFALPAIAQAQELNGAQQYSRHCGRCHNFRAPMEKTDAEWDVIVAHMQNVGNMTGAQSRAIREFLQANNNPVLSGSSAQTAKTSAAPVATGMSGKQIFASNGCVGCHSIGGQGGTVGPSLDGLFSRRSQDYIVQQIKNSRAHNPASVMPQFNFAEQDLNSLLRFLQAGS